MLSLFPAGSDTLRVMLLIGSVAVLAPAVVVAFVALGSQRWHLRQQRRHRDGLDMRASRQNAPQVFPAPLAEMQSAGSDAISGLPVSRRKAS